MTATVTAQGSFSGTVTFACTGLPTGATCSFNPAVRNSKFDRHHCHNHADRLDHGTQRASSHAATATRHARPAHHRDRGCTALHACRRHFRVEDAKPPAALRYSICAADCWDGGPDVDGQLRRHQWWRRRRWRHIGWHAHRFHHRDHHRHKRQCHRHAELHPRRAVGPAGNVGSIDSPEFMHRMRRVAGLASWVSQSTCVVSRNICDAPKALGHESGVGQQLLKTWLGAQRVQARVHFKPAEFAVPVHESFLQRIHGFVLFTQR